MVQGTGVEEPVGIQRVHAVLDWLDYARGREEAIELLTAFRAWLATEAVVAGGIGPSEVARLWSRHIADSLTFMAGLNDPSTVVDVGSGVGLPGIPLAIVLQATDFTLLDRSERRCDLASRAIRILGLRNVEVVQGDYGQMRLPHEAAVSRAVAAPLGFLAALRRLLPEGTHAVLGGSHGTTEPPESKSLEIIRVPEHVMGDETWLVKVSLSA